MSETGTAAARSTARSDLAIAGRTLTLRYPQLGDAPALFELGSDPAVTRYFSWGPYRALEQAETWIESLPAKRESGELLMFLVVHETHGPVGVTGLSEPVRRDRRCVLGSWFGHRFWGGGANAESKALIARLAFERLGAERLTTYAATRNGRSQAALERLGFRREGVLAAWHRHGDEVHDVVIYGMLKKAFDGSPLAQVPAEITGDPPPAFVLRPDD